MPARFQPAGSPHLLCSNNKKFLCFPCANPCHVREFCVTPHYGATATGRSDGGGSLSWDTSGVARVCVPRAPATGCKQWTANDWCIANDKIYGCQHQKREYIDRNNSSLRNRWVTPSSATASRTLAQRSLISKAWIQGLRHWQSSQQGCAQ